MRSRIPTLCVGLVLLLATLAGAQFDVNGPNAVLTLQGEVPSMTDPVAHDVTVPVPGIFDLRIATNVNPGVPLLLLYSPMSPTTGNVFPVPWGGSIDIGTAGVSVPGGIVLVGDGLGLSVGPLDPFFASNQGSAVLGTPPEFVLSLAAGTALDGSHAAFQGIVQDPTQPPFNLDNTEAVDANFQGGQIVIATPTSSGSFQVPFISGKVFNFHGTSYTEVFLNANGYVNFSAGSSVANGGFTIDAVSFLNAEPAIAIFLADWQSGASNQILYQESSNQVRIAYGDPTVQTGGLSHFGDNDSNMFEVTLQLQDQLFSNPNDGNFKIDLVQMDPTATVQNGSGLIGHTPGGLALMGGGADTDLHANPTGGLGVAQIEEHDNNQTNATLLGYDGMGTPRAYNWIHSWNTQNIVFQPQPWALVPGDTGYTATASAPAPDDVRGVDVNSLDVAGGEIIHVVGKFHGFADMLGQGTVVFDPAGLALPATVVGVVDGTASTPFSLPNTPSMSPFRDFEGVEIVTPAFPAPGTYDMQVNFMNGSTFTVPVTVVNSGIVLTSYPVTSGSNVFPHTLTVPVSLYGLQYTNFFLHGHGYVTFGSSNSDFSESLPEFFAGWQAAGTTTPRPGVAVMWSDLNNPNSLGSPSPTIDVTEDTTVNTVNVSFSNQYHWSTGNPAGTASVTFGGFGPNSLTFDHSGFLGDSNPAGNSHNVIIGVTDGDDQVGSDTNLTDGTGTGLVGAIGTYTSAMGPDSFAEQIPTGVTPALGIWNVIDTGDGMTIPFGTWTIF